MVIKINIYLVGMMGSGKSTIGQILAEQLKMKWIDMDEAIEARGMAISEIFEVYGEPHFRALETETLITLSKQKNMVVSTGGGVVLSSMNTDLMRVSGKVVYLKAEPETLLRNLESGRAHRPLIKTGELRLRVNELLSQRANIYEACCDLTVITDGLSPTAVAKSVRDGLNL